MAKWFCGCGFVCAVNAGPRSSSAPIATAGSATAVCIAGTRSVWISGAAPMWALDTLPVGQPVEVDRLRFDLYVREGGELVEVWSDLRFGASAEAGSARHWGEVVRADSGSASARLAARDPSIETGDFVASAARIGRETGWTPRVPLARVFGSLAIVTI